MVRLLWQSVCFALFAVAIGYFSAAPAYRHMSPEQAMLRVSISHAGQLVGECRQRSAAELQKLSPNMRAAQDCPRERSPVSIEVEFDGGMLYRETIQPSGLSRDGASTIYRRIPVAAGPHRIAVRMNDSVKHAGFDYQHVEQVHLRAGQVLVVDFNREGGVVIK